MIEQQLRDLFAETAGHEPAAPSQVDIQRARRQGRARLRWRRAITGGTSLLAAAGVAVLLVTVIPGPPDPAPVDPGPPAPRAFSPLVTNLSFGWLPAGLSVQQGGVLPQEAFAAIGGSSASGGFGVYVYARGQCHLTRSARGLTCPDPALADESVTFSRPAPPVNGGRALWSTRILTWQLSPASKLHPRPHDTGVWTNAVYVVASRALKSSTCAATDASIQITRTTINGYRAVLSHGIQNGQPLQGLCVSHADGLAFGIRELGPHPYTSVTRLFRQHIRLLGGNAAHWTQNPFG
jgi:hypothetical protein